jgi:crotonobetainyl-CoA:carnitine CoA-transferase CaiB-like acyl-CoA transferase
MVEWANEEGMLMEFKDSDFSQWDQSTITQEENDQRSAIVGDFLKTKTKAELYEQAVKRGIMLAPCNTIADTIMNAQLEARGFWEKVEHPELGETITYPGAPLKIKETPWRIQRRAPLIGEHNEEVFVEELGFSREEMAVLKASGVV